MDSWDSLIHDIEHCGWPVDFKKFAARLRALPSRSETGRCMGISGAPRGEGEAMSPDEAVAAIHSGSLVECSEQEWPAIREAIQKQAAKWIEWGDGIRATIALREVERLDKEFDHAS